MKYLSVCATAVAHLENFVAFRIVTMFLGSNPTPTLGRKRQAMVTVAEREMEMLMVVIRRAMWFAVTK